MSIDVGTAEAGRSAGKLPGRAARPLVPAVRRRRGAAAAGSRRGTISLLLASQVALGLLIAATTGTLLMNARERALQEAGHELRSLSLTLADQAERTFEAVDLVQTTFMEMVRNDGAQTPEDFRKRMSGREVNKELLAHGSGLAQLDIIGLVDAAGRFINLSMAWPLPDISISDRPYFQALRDNPGQATIVSDPIVNRVTHTLAVVIAHRINNPEGRFLGISFAGVLMSYFEKLYKTVVNNEATAISLFREDGMLLARYPAEPAPTGKTLVTGSIIDRLAASGRDSEIALQTSQYDGTQRLIAAHKLSHYPMMVAVSATTSSILAGWRRQAAYLISTAILLEAVVVWVGVLMLRHSRNERMLADARAAQHGAEAELALGQERARADRELQVQAARFGAALGNMSEVLCMFDAGDSLVVGNDRLAAMLGLPASAIAPGTTIDRLRALLANQSGLLPPDLEELYNLILRLKFGRRRASHALDMADGRRLAVNFAPMACAGWLVTLEDITQQRIVEAKIAHMAHHDALTGLPNRILFRQRLDGALARCRRDEQYAVLCLDLDRFKAVNDTLGHPAGDALLRDVTQRLVEQVRGVDTVARLGGDEFAIVQAIGKPTDCTAMAERLIEALGTPYEIDGNTVVIGVSIGIAIVMEDGDDADEIMKNADMALYRSKAQGRGRYQFFEPQMNAQSQARRALELDLRAALANGDFRVYYQPLMDIANGLVSGFEALVRWQHPERGMVPPGDFIPLAEEIGLIVPLGNWVLRQACADAAAWPGALKLAVNLSPVQLGSYALIENVESALHESGLSPSRLELEITETAILTDIESVLTTLHQLQYLGLAIALDDFGTGFSSLSHLQRFPFDKVKIDRSFVARLDQAGCRNDDAIVASVIELCGRIGMRTTAEGVETSAQLDRLASLRCVEAQGYLFSQARPASEIPALLERLNGGNWRRPVRPAMLIAG